MVIRGKTLLTVDIFKGTSEEDLNSYLLERENLFKYQIIEKGGYLVKILDPIDRVYFILSGEFYTSSTSSDGKKARIHTLPSGEVVASAFIFGNSPFYPVSVIASKKSYVISIKRDDFLDLLGKFPNVLLLFLNEISSKILVLSEKLKVELYGETIEDKLHKYINMHKKDNVITFNPSITAVAESFGVERPSLSRTLSKMVKEGSLERISNKVFRVT